MRPLFTYFLEQLDEVATLISPILEMRQLRHRERKGPVQGHTVGKEAEP